MTPAVMRKEIADETDKETGCIKQISSVPIHPSIYAPNDVMNLGLSCMLGIEFSIGSTVITKSGGFGQQNEALVLVLILKMRCCVVRLQACCLSFSSLLCSRFGENEG